MIAAKAVMDSLLEHAADVESLAVLSRFRVDFHACLTARALYDAVNHGRIDIGRLRRSLAGLALPRADGRRAGPGQTAGPASTAASWPCPTRPPGRTRRSRPAR